MVSATPPIPDFVPSVFFAGETVVFTRSFANYSSADGWGYSIHFNGALAVVHKNGVPDSGGFKVTLDPVADLAVAPGLYKYIERVQLGAEVHTVGNGSIEIEPNLATAPAGATVSHNVRMVALLEAALEGRIPADLQSYQIAGRAIVKLDIRELQHMLGNYKAKVWREANPGQLTVPVEVQFSGGAQPDLPATWADVTGFEVL